MSEKVFDKMIENLKDENFIKEASNKISAPKDYQVIEYAGKLLLKHVNIMIDNKIYNDFGLTSEGTAYDLFNISNSMKKSEKAEKELQYDSLLSYIAETREELYRYGYCFDNGLIADPIAVIESIKNEVVRLREEGKKK